MPAYGSMLRANQRSQIQSNEIRLRVPCCSLFTRAHAGEHQSCPCTDALSAGTWSGALAMPDGTVVSFLFVLDR